MLEDKDRIFKNLYNDFGSDLDSAKKRGDWEDTRAICAKGKEWIIKEIKDSQRRLIRVFLAPINQEEFQEASLPVETNQR